MEINLKITDESKAQIVLSLLKDLSYVEINIKKSDGKNKKPSFDDIFGIWKDHEISAKELRTKAWVRKI